MLFKDSALLDRMFRIFDRNDDNVISFDEYINCLSVISNKASKDDKMKCKRLRYDHSPWLSIVPSVVSFQIYDFDCDGSISVSDLTAVVAASLREHGVVITRVELDKLVNHTMVEAAPKVPGMISYEEYDLCSGVCYLSLIVCVYVLVGMRG